MTEDRPGRTFELWVLALGLLGMSLSGWLRVQAALSAWNFLIQAGINPGPLYQAVMGAAWGLGGLVCAPGLLLRGKWAPGVTRFTVLLLAAWYWLDFAFFTQAPDARDNWPYMLVLTAIGVGFTFAVLALNRQKRFFQ